MVASVPVLSTPAEHIFEEATPAVVPAQQSRLSEEQLYIQYEIRRTISEIRDGKWKRIALQFPDEMLVDAPRVFERLRDGLKSGRSRARQAIKERESNVESIGENLKNIKLEEFENNNDDEVSTVEDVEERLCILGDTSYGACCVDEIAAEHVDADVVVHYGRSCLSPTPRLPVIYVFTSPPLDIHKAMAAFEETYPDKHEKVCLMADVPYTHHVPVLYERLQEEGYENIFATEVLHDPSSLLPNRTIPPEAQADPEALKGYSVFHISDPPTSLLLILTSRVKRIQIFPTTTPSTPMPTTLEATTTALLRRRYALLTRIPSTPILGILINTLSVSNYASAIAHVQDLISAAGKKSYLFGVGKVNAAKIANFSEVGAWVVIGCWESSLLESKDFYAPVVTPFELEVALSGEASRVWGGEWVGGFESLLGREVNGGAEGVHLEHNGNEAQANGESNGSGNWDDQPSDDEPPDFDLRTGRYISQTRPMGRSKPTNGATISSAPPSSALIQRAKGDVATINGAVSPGAEFLRSKRTWQGLGSDQGAGSEIAYERNEDGSIRGAAMEEGRAGVAKGYAVGDTART